MNLRPFISLLKLRVVSLLLLVAVATAIIAGGKSVDPLRLLVLVVVGVMAAGGCLAVNSFCDLDIDTEMSRTRGRPLVLQEMGRPVIALLYGIVLLSIAIAASAYLLNILTAFFVTLGAVVYLFVYTIWLKRRTSLSIIWGGFAGCCPVLAGWASVTNSVSLEAGMLALLVLLWIPAHNWTFAIKFQDDYRKVGIPVLPSIIGNAKTLKVILVASIILLLNSLGMTLLGYANWAYLSLAGLLGLASVAQILWIMKDELSIARVWRTYKFLSIYLALLFVALAVEATIL